MAQQNAQLLLTRAAHITRDINGKNQARQRSHELLEVRRRFVLQAVDHVVDEGVIDVGAFAAGSPEALGILPSLKFKSGPTLFFSWNAWLGEMCLR